MSGRRTFDDWLQEVREIVQEIYEVDLEQMPEFDRADARSYFKDRSSPSLYFRECLSEFEEGEKLEQILRVVPDS